MKYGMLTLALLLGVRGAAAQDRIPEDEAKKIAELLVEAAAKLRAPLPVKGDPARPYGKRHRYYSALVVPARDLKAEALDRAGDRPVPVGQLFLHALAPVADGKVLPSKDLLQVTVPVRDMEFNAGLCCLAVQKIEGKPSLLFLGADHKPLLTVPLEKITQEQEMPIEFLVSIEGDDRAAIVLTLLGCYRGRFHIGVLTE